MNCYLVAPGPGATAIVIKPGEGVTATLDYYFDTNALTPAPSTRIGDERRYQPA